MVGAPNVMGIKSIHTKIGGNTASKKHAQAQKFNLDILDSNYNIGGSDDDEDQQNNQNYQIDKDGNSLVPQQDFFDASNMLSPNQTPYNFVPQGELVGGNSAYTGRIQPQEYPGTYLDQNDYVKRMRFDQLQNLRRDELCGWKQKDIKGIKKNIYIKEIIKKNAKILSVTEKNNLEKNKIRKDDFPCLEVRKYFNKIRILIQMICFQIQASKLFQNLSITIIGVNSAVMIAQDPTSDQKIPFFTIAEDVFNILYSLEMFIKILGLGLILNKGAYLRDYWNILDFIIVISSYPQYFQNENEDGGGLQIKGLRVFRVLRPLKTISSIKGLKVLIQALFQAMPLLGDTLSILVFFFFIMAIAGTNLMQGNLKNRCVAIQTGMIQGTDDPPFCSSNDSCPGGFFCGKMNANPNYGVTNFDIITYSFLAVFQSVTLEGWSDIQRDMSKAYSPWIFLYFILVVMVGAFFLLNLTLAVINAEFTNAHKEHIAQEQEKLQISKKIMLENELDEAMNQKDEMSIAQFITARIYAKKMIEFLRRRQQIKRVENERLKKMKQKEIAFAQAKRKIPLIKDISKKNLKSERSQVTIITPKKKKNQDEMIPEDIVKESDDESDNQLEKDIMKFLKDQRQHLQNQSQLGNTMKKTEQFIQREKEGGIPSMKGNIGPTSKFNIGINTFQSQQKELFSKMAEEFAIDKVIPDRNNNLDNKSDVNKSIKSFKLSINNDEIESHFNSSYEGNKSVPLRMINGMNDIPGYVNDINGSDGPVTSDSNFEIAAGEGHGEGKNIVPINKKKVDIQKDVSKTFRKMLRQNNKADRGKYVHNGNNLLDQSNESTKFGGSFKNDYYGEDNDNNSQTNSEIEKKFCKKKVKKSLQKIYFKEDDRENSFIRQDKDVTDPVLKVRDDKLEFLEFQETINTKRPRDPFKDINKLTQKVQITADKAYKGTSSNDVFFLRFQKENESQPLEENKFLMLAPKNQIEEEKLKSQVVLRPHCHPYQQKVFYDIEKDVIFEEGSSDNEDILQAQEQPYITTTSINYHPLLNHVPTKELARRSDILITSTMSISLFPKDKRVIMTKYRAKSRSEDPSEKFDINLFIKEKNIFNALVKDHYYSTGMFKDKEKNYTDAYSKSFIHRQRFKSLTMQLFKDQVKQLNCNEKPKKVVDPKVIELEKIKHQQNQKAVAKRGDQDWDKETAQRLLEGKYWDLEEGIEDNGETPNNMNVKIAVQNREDMQQKNLMDNFENKLRDIIRSDKDARSKFICEIPNQMKKQFNLPQQMGPFSLNFNQVKAQDFSLKRQSPMWSGQDVIPQLDQKKSTYIIHEINMNRVWPTGLGGLIKRIRYQLRILVKSSLFESSMTFAVLLNTITLSCDHYGIDENFLNLLNQFNDIFTWIFIVEMSFKILAIGISKYCGDRMNWLDGGVVILSIVELVANSIIDGQQLGLDAFKTIRILRTFRVLRIARLLKALESMKTIMDVLIRSYKSFIYIILLMFLFIFIFSLLGMNIFGGQMNYEDGTPKNNYDNFSIAFITVFQVLTMENWQTVLFDTMRSETVSPYLVAIYYIFWVFIGNFILLNLFLAILLDSFLDEEDTEEQIEAEEELKQKIIQAKKAQKQRKNSNKLFMDVQRIQKKLKDGTDPSKMYFGEFKAESEGEDLEDMDEEQIVKIYKEEGLLKKDDEELRQIKLFINIECEQSIYLFSKQNKFRIFCYKCIKFKYWEKIVQTLIILSSLKLAFDTYFYYEKKDSQIVKVSTYVDWGFNYLFLIEMILKITAKGFVMDSGSYLRESWDKLDFFIVITSIMDMALTGVEIGFIKIFRMLRVLRPLRFINHNVNLKMVVVALLDSVSSIFNVVVVLALVFLIFAILGVSFYGGKLQYCSIDMYNVQTEQECLLMLGQWMTYDYNFDDVGSSMITLFVVASLESWPDIMQQTLDITGEELGPTKDLSTVNMIFFVFFILIGNFLLLNFFIGVLFLKFNEAQKEEEKGFSKDDLVWQDIQKLIISAKPEYESTNVPDASWRIYFHDLVTSKRFEVFIYVAIIMNMFQMAMLHENQSKGFSGFMDFSNYIFTIIFIFEAMFKLFAFGKSYFKNSWNKFDFFVVISSIFDILIKALQNVITGGGFLAVAPSIARIMRVLRVTRVLRLLNKTEGLQAIIQTIAFSITPLSNVIILLLLIYFMFAILGNFLFWDILQGNGMDAQVNFENFGQAFLLLFSISTGENWPVIMMDCSRDDSQGCIPGISCGNKIYAVIYFFCMVIVCTYIMLNLFVLVIIQQFDKYFIPKENMITNFKQDLANFLKVWKIFTQKKFRCKKIKESQLQKFFRALGESGDIETNLGFHKDYYNEGELKKNLLKMGIKSDQGSIYFNELLYRCMKRRYGNIKLNKKMQIFELRTQYKIFQITLREKSNGKPKKIVNDDILTNIVKKENGVNPFLTVMNFKITFKTWLKFARKRVRQEIKQTAKQLQIDQIDIDNDQTDEEEENQKPYEVLIEMEYLTEVTSEEETDQEPFASQGTINNRKLNYRSNREIGSVFGSVRGSDQKPSVRRSYTKRKQDHLKMFEKSLTMKIKQVQQNSNRGKASPRY